MQGVDSGRRIKLFGPAYLAAWCILPGNCEHALDYYGARYYDPALGQFTSADTTASQLNRYAAAHLRHGAVWWSCDQSWRELRAAHLVPDEFGWHGGAADRGRRGIVLRLRLRRMLAQH